MSEQPIEVYGIWLRRTIGNNLEVLAEVMGEDGEKEWRVVIDGYHLDCEPRIGHIVEPAGIRCASPGPAMTAQDAAAAGGGERTWHWAIERPHGIPNERRERWEHGAFTCCCTDDKHYGSNEDEASDGLDDVQRLNKLTRRAALVAPLVEALRREHFVMRRSNHRDCPTCALIAAAGKEME